MKVIQKLDFDQTWSDIIMQKGIIVLENILKNNLKNLNNDISLFENNVYIEIYTACYYLCIQDNKNCEKIYLKYIDTIRTYLEKCLNTDFNNISIGIDIDYIYINKFINIYDKFTIFSKWLRHFFVYINKIYNSTGEGSLEYNGYLQYKNIFFDKCKKFINNNLFNMIYGEREKLNEIDNNLFHSCLTIYINLEYIFPDIYKNDFCEPFIEYTNNYYSTKSLELIETCSVPDYLSKIEDIINIEYKIVSKYLYYLNYLVKEPLFNSLNHILIEKHINQLITNNNSGFNILIEKKMYNDLSRMYRLFERINGGLNILTEYFKKYIVGYGQTIINSRILRIEDKSLTDVYEDPLFIKELIELYNDMLYFVKNFFYENYDFSESLNKAFTEIINVNIKDIKSADLLAIYIDKLLKSGGEKMNESEIENQIDKVIILFKYLTDKDIFEDTYRNLLSKRILNQRLTNDDIERQTISKMKLICGSQFSFKLEGMMNDLLSCNNESEHFQNFIINNNNNNNLKCIDFNVQIFTNGYWPLLKSVRVIFPNIMQKCIDTFTQFYKNRMSSHKITWQHAYGNVTMKSTFKGKSYDIQVSTLQSIVMISFNDHEILDFYTLSKLTNLEDDILRRVLHSLSCGKFKIIKKLESPDSTDKVVKNTDVFQFNNNFTCPTRKFRIPMAALDDIKSNVKKIEEDRTHLIDASIVRIMKSRKTLLHQTLIADILSQLSTFKPDVKQVKKRIESLIERDYIERDSNNNSLYNYLA